MMPALIWRIFDEETFLVAQPSRATPSTNKKCGIA